MKNLVFSMSKLFLFTITCLIIKNYSIFEKVEILISSYLIILIMFFSILVKLYILLYFLKFKMIQLIKYVFIYDVKSTYFSLLKKKKKFEFFFS